MVSSLPNAALLMWTSAIPSHFFLSRVGVAAVTLLQNNLRKFDANTVCNMSFQVTDADIGFNGAINRHQTLRKWHDVFFELELDESRFVLVAVEGLPLNSLLFTLLDSVFNKNYLRIISYHRRWTVTCTGGEATWVAVFFVSGLLVSSHGKGVRKREKFTNAWEFFEKFHETVFVFQGLSKIIVSEMYFLTKTAVNGRKWRTSGKWAMFGSNIFVLHCILSFLSWWELFFLCCHSHTPILISVQIMWNTHYCVLNFIGACKVFG